MATPHGAGAAALLLQLHPEWTPDNVKSALANTSLDLGYDAYTQGAGRIQLVPAANTPAVATPSSLSFGLDDLSLDLWEVSETLTFSNLSDSTVTYALTWSPTFRWGQLSRPIGHPSCWDPGSRWK